MAQTNWSSLGTPGPQSGSSASPTVAHNADGRLEVFLQTQDGTVWHIRQTSPGAGWSTWVSLNKPANVSNGSLTAVGMNADGRLEIFIVDNGVLWHTWQTTAGGDWYNSWFSSGRPSGAGLQMGLTVVSNTDGRLEAFGGGSDGALWHIWQTTPNGTWSPWSSLNSPAGFPVAGRDADGRIEVFTLNEGLWHIGQTTAGGNWNTTSFSLGQPSATVGAAPATTPVVSQNADGRLEVFTLDSDGAIWHISQTSPGGDWSAWSSLSRPANTQFTTLPTVGRNADGCLEVLVTGNDGALWHIVQTSPGGGWNTWDTLGAPPNTSLTFSGPFVAANTDGRLEVFAVPGGTLWHASQVAPGGPWG
jgi:hypothetical protein